MMQLPCDLYELDLWADAVNGMSFALYEALLANSFEGKAYATAAWGISTMAQIVQEGIWKLGEKIVAEHEVRKPLHGHAVQEVATDEQ